MFNWILFAVFCGLIFLDKFLTVLNIKQFEKNFSPKDKYSIERNPIAKWFFKKTGLLIGSIGYGVISLVTVGIGYYLWRLLFGHIIAVWVMIAIYILVILNNSFWFLKYAKVVK